MDFADYEYVNLKKLVAQIRGNAPWAVRAKTEFLKRLAAGPVAVQYEPATEQQGLLAAQLGCDGAELWAVRWCMREDGLIVETLRKVSKGSCRPMILDRITTLALPPVVERCTACGHALESPQPTGK